MGFGSWQQFLADALVLSVCCGIALCARHGLRDVASLALSSVVGGVLLTIVVCVAGYWYGPRSDPKPQAWFVERVRQYAESGTTGMREVDTDVVAIRGPFDRESECIATLEDPATGERIDDGLECDRDDADTHVVPDPGP